MTPEQLKSLHDDLQVLQAVQVLEHHDKNWLRDPASTSKEKIKLVASITDRLFLYTGHASISKGKPVVL